MKKKVSVLFAALFTITLIAFVPGQTPWPVPDTDKNKANPLKGDAASVATGISLYNTLCI